MHCSKVFFFHNVESQHGLSAKMVIFKTTNSFNAIAASDRDHQTLLPNSIQFSCHCFEDRPILSMSRNALFWIPTCNRGTRTTNSGADSMGHGGAGTCTPHFYKWLGTGVPWVEEQPTRMSKLHWPPQKRSLKRLIVLLEPKEWRGTTKNFFRRFTPDRCRPPLSLRTGAPNKFVPAPLTTRSLLGLRFCSPVLQQVLCDDWRLCRVSSYDGRSCCSGYDSGWRWHDNGCGVIKARKDGLHKRSAGWAGERVPLQPLLVSTSSHRTRVATEPVRATD